MAELIRLKNRGPVPFVATLFHDAYCRRGGKCGCRQEKHLSSVVNRQTGETGLRESMRAAPVGFSIPPGETSPPMHRAVLYVPGVAEAVKATPPVLVVVEVAAAPAPKSRPVVPSAPAEDSAIASGSSRKR